VTNCGSEPQLLASIKDLKRFLWHEVTQIQHYWLDVDVLTQRMQVREDSLDDRR
jgi:hypothetical protein